MIILEHEDEDIRERALALFAGKARRAVRLRGEVNIRVTSSREMRELNRRFRKQTKPTDVLSFPSGLPKSAGNIAISAEIAASNAAQLGHSTETELKFLILHDCCIWRATITRAITAKCGRARPNCAST